MHVERQKSENKTSNCDPMALQWKLGYSFSPKTREKRKDWRVWKSYGDSTPRQGGCFLLQRHFYFVFCMHILHAPFLSFTSCCLFVCAPWVRFCPGTIWLFCYHDRQIYSMSTGLRDSVFESSKVCVTNFAHTRFPELFNHGPEMILKEERVV